MSISLDTVYWVVAADSFTYYYAPRFSSIDPTSVSSKGFYTVQLTGAGFFSSDTLYCKFKFPTCGGDVIEYPGIFVDSTNIKCLVPPYVICSSCNIDVTFNGIEYFSATTSLAYINIPEVYSLSPAFAHYQCKIFYSF